MSQLNIGRNVRDFIERGYKPGSILRVHMVNFLTYDNCEVMPGPRLNVVLGPNGTGKSTMTHAICLGCAGSPLSIGRAPELFKFVKNDKQNEECFIEVDILSNVNSIYTIRRVINSTNKSSFWFLNGEKSKEAAIKDIMNMLSIDMNNLCSFMAQDRVGKFTRLTPKEVLQETLKSISAGSDGNKSLHDIQLELSSFEENKLRSQEVKIAKQSLITQLESQIGQLKGDVDRMNQRQELLNRLEVAKLAEKLFLLEEIDKERQQQQTTLQGLNTDLARANEKISPLEVKERDLKRKQQVADKMIEAAKQSCRKAEDKLKGIRDVADQIDIEVQSNYAQLQEIQRVRASHESKLQIARNDLIQRKQELNSSIESLPTIKSNMNDVTNRLNSHRNKEMEFEEKYNHLRNDMKQRDEQIRDLNREMNGLKDVGQVFRARLRSKRGVWNAQRIIEIMDWIDENRHTFKDEVYGPVGRHISVADPACAVMIEHAIPFKVLTSTFIALNEEDAAKLKAFSQQVSNKGIVIITLSNQLRPAIQSEPNRYQHIGIQGHLISQLNCPDHIITYLYQFLSLQNVLWAKIDPNRIKINRDDIVDVSIYRLYVLKLTNRASSSVAFDVTCYNGTRSRYGARNVTVQTEIITPQDVPLLGNGDGDTLQKRHELEERLASLNHHQQQRSNELTTIERTLEDLRREIKNLREEKSKFQRALNLPQEKQAQHDSSMKKVADLEALLSQSVEDQKELKIKHYKLKIEEFQAVMKGAVESCKSVIQSQTNVTVCEDSKTNLYEQIRQACQDIEEARGSLRDIKRSIETTKAALQKHDQHFRKVGNEIREIEEQKGEEEFNNLMQSVGLLSMKTSEGMREIIDSIELQLKRNVNNPAVIQRYNELKSKLEVEREEYRNIEDSFNNIENDLKDRSSDWLDKVENVRRKLHDLFSEYMNELKFKGEVELVKSGKFSEYEMQMKVAFRDDAAVTNLSGYRHSGGERNVSTMMYLMALQGMTTSPFRIVDEINQGMDERNERLVCDRIVRNCCGSKRSPQYFLVTPKLLEALQALNHDDITVLVVFNGPGAGIDWNIGKYIQKLTQKYPEILSKDDEYNSVDSGSDNDDTTDDIGRKRYSFTASQSEKKRQRIVN